MMFGNYFTREKFTYWFSCLFPIILATEICIYASVTEVTTDIKEMIDILIVGLAVIASGIMLIIQFISCMIFLVRLRKLTWQQKEKLREAARNSKKTGRILQSDEVLIYYGKYSKNVILKNQINTMESYIDSDFKRVRGGAVITEMNYIIIKRELGRDIALMCPMKVLDGYKGELPWNCMIVSAWLGIALAIMALYPMFMNFFIDENDIIEKVLFYAGYDWLFWLVSAIIIIVIWFGAFRLKKKNIDNENYTGMDFKMTTFWFYICVAMFGGLFFQEKYEDSNLARDDFKAYREEEYEQTIGYAENIYEKYLDTGTRYMSIFMEEQGIGYDTLSCRMDERGMEYESFILIECDDDIDLEQDVSITYLENTKIVIDVEEVK